MTTDENTNDDAQPSRLAAMLGWGYDIFGAVADPGFATQPLFRSDETRTITVAPGVQWSLPGFSGYLRNDRREKRTIFASHRGEWLRKKGQQYGLKGKYSFFSGQANTNFKDTWSTKKQQDFFEVIDEVVLGLCVLPVDLAILRGMLEPGFARALLHDDPHEVFRVFGTHYVSQLVIGGTIRFLGSLDRNETLDQRSREAGVKVAFNQAVASAEFNASFTAEEKSYAQSVRRNARLSVLGGRVAEAQRVEDPEDKAGVSSWVSSVPDNPVVLDFGPKRGIVPIWELVADPVRRHDLEVAFVAFARQRGQILEPPTIVAISNDIQQAHGTSVRRVMRVGTEPPPNALQIPILTAQDHLEEAGWQYGKSQWNLHVRVPDRTGYGEGIELVELDGQPWVIVGGYQTVDGHDDKYLGFGVTDDPSLDHRPIGRCRVRLRQLNLQSGMYGDATAWLVLAKSSSWTGPRYSIVGGFDDNVVMGTVGPGDREHLWGDALEPMTVPVAKCTGWSEGRGAWGDSTLTFCYREL